MNTLKTRLAQAVGVDVATAFSHGACFVALASVSAETGVVTALPRLSRCSPPASTTR